MSSSTPILPQRRPSRAVVTTMFLLAACSKTSSRDVPAAASGAIAASAPPSSSGASPTAQGKERSVWSGAYNAKVGSVDPPPNAKEKTWTLDPGTAAIGKGTIDLAIGERGETRGETKGALGDMTVSGTYDGHELRANLVPANPKTDGAMTGFMVLVSEGPLLKGTLRAANRDARIVREATVELAKK